MALPLLAVPMTVEMPSVVAPALPVVSSFLEGSGLLALPDGLVGAVLVARPSRGGGVVAL
jgi:hypothetical protein